MRLGHTLTIFFAGIFLQPALVCAYSPAEGNVSATFGAFLHQTNFNLPPPGLNASLRRDFALILNGDLHDRGALEIGIYHLFKQYFKDVGGRFVGEDTEQIDIAIGYRHWLSPSVSTSLTFTSSYSMGQPNLFYNDFSPDTSVDTSARDTTEYALALSVQLDLFTFRRVTAVLSGLYSLSLTGKPGERADHYGALIGLRYFIQEKQVVDRPKTSIPQESP